MSDSVLYLVILVYMLFASLFTIQKDMLSYCAPFFLVGSRMFLAGFFLLIFWYFRYPKEILPIRTKHLKSLFLLSLFQIYLTNILEAWALERMVSSKACLLYSLSPFASALMAYIVLKDKLTLRMTAGMLIGFLGLIPVVLVKTQAEAASGGLFIFTYPDLAMLVAVFCSVYGWILLKKIQQQYSYPTVLANGISMTIGGIMSLMHSYLGGEVWAPIPVTDMRLFLINTLISCLISNVICYNLYGYLLTRFSATFLSFAGLVTPLFAALFGFVWLNEFITWHFFLALALCSVGLYVYYRDERRLHYKISKVTT